MVSTNGTMPTNDTQLSPDLAKLQQTLRSHFPYLVDTNKDWIFLENAGGSAITDTSIQRVADYMRNSCVQVGAGYPASDRATKTVEDCHKMMNIVMGGESTGKVVLGDSTSRLAEMLSYSYLRSKLITSQHEIVTAQNGHQANIGPWTRLAELTGAKHVEWKITSDETNTANMDINDLKQLVNSNTRIVAVVHCSNLLGTTLDVKEVCKVVHAANPQARVIVDGVAYSPHKVIDVAEYDADYYLLSNYKLYGPHQAALYGKNEAWQELLDNKAKANHHFTPNAVGYGFELGCLNHELLAGVLGLADYLNAVVQKPADTPLTREIVVEAFKIFNQMERPTTVKLLQYLNSKDSVTVIGSKDVHAVNRVPTISFVHNKHKPSEIVKHLHQHKIACRNSHCYAYNLVKALPKLIPDSEEGVVRISAVHYNTAEEIDRVIEVLEKIL